MSLGSGTQRCATTVDFKEQQDIESLLYLFLLSISYYNHLFKCLQVVPSDTPWENICDPSYVGQLRNSATTTPRLAPTGPTGNYS